jgi:hypothetical protein
MRPTHDREPMNHEEVRLRCEECQMTFWKACEVVPAGNYVLVEYRSNREVILDLEGPLPAMFDGPVALYCTSACACRDHVHRKRAVDRDG